MSEEANQSGMKNEDTAAAETPVDGAKKPRWLVPVAGLTALAAVVAGGVGLYLKRNNADTQASSEVSAGANHIYTDDRGVRRDDRDNAAVFQPMPVQQAMEMQRLLNRHYTIHDVVEKSDGDYATILVESPTAQFTVIARDTRRDGNEFGNVQVNVRPKVNGRAVLQDQAQTYTVSRVTFEEFKTR